MKTQSRTATTNQDWPGVNEGSAERRGHTADIELQNDILTQLACFSSTYEL
jgi:hypothetical protein